MEEYNNSMPIMQKIIVIVITILVIIGACYFFINYEIMSSITTIEKDITNDDNINITNIVPTTLEKYKIINIEHQRNRVYAIVHLSNGNIKIIEFTEAYIDPNLKNINEGYLYRDGQQIYIRAE